jgi:hypothetical protein
MRFRDRLDDGEWKEKRRYDLKKVAKKACRLSDYPARWFVQHPNNIALGKAAWERTAKHMRQSRQRELIQRKEAQEEAEAQAESEEDAAERAARQRKHVRRLSLQIPDHWDEELREETATAKHEDCLESAKNLSDVECFGNVPRKASSARKMSATRMSISSLQSQGSETPGKRDPGLPWLSVMDRGPNSLCLSLSNICQAAENEVHAHIWPSPARVIGGWNAFAEAMETGIVVKVEVQYRLRGRDNWTAAQQPAATVQSLRGNRSKTEGTFANKSVVSLPRSTSCSQRHMPSSQRKDLTRMNSSKFIAAGYGTEGEDTLLERKNPELNLTTELERNMYNTKELASHEINLTQLKGLWPSAMYEVRARCLNSNEDGSEWSPFSQVLVASTTEQGAEMTYVDLADMKKFSLFDSQARKSRSAVGKFADQITKLHASSLDSSSNFASSAVLVDLLVAHCWDDDKIPRRDFERFKLEKCNEYEERQQEEGASRCCRYWLDTGCLAPALGNEGLKIIPGIMNKCKTLLVLLSPGCINELWWLYTVACFFSLKNEDVNIEVKLVCGDASPAANGRPIWSSQQSSLLEEVRERIDELSLTDRISIGSMPRDGTDAHIECLCVTDDWQALLMQAGALFGSVERFQGLLQTLVLPSLYTGYIAIDAPGKPVIEVEEVQQARGGLWERKLVSNRPRMQLVVKWKSPVCTRRKNGDKQARTEGHEVEYQLGCGGEWKFLTSTLSLSYKIKVQELVKLFSESGAVGWDTADDQESSDNNIARIVDTLRMRVRACYTEDPSDSGCGLYSLAAAVTCPPPALAALTSGLLTSSSVEVRWTHPVYHLGVIKGYRVKWREEDHDDDDEAGSTEAGAGALGETISGLKPGLKYIVSVSAFTDTMEGATNELEVYTKSSDVQERKKKATQAMQVNARRMRRQSLMEEAEKKETELEKQAEKTKTLAKKNKRRDLLAAQFKIGVQMKIKAQAARSKVEDQDVKSKGKSMNAKLLSVMTEHGEESDVGRKRGASRDSKGSKEKVPADGDALDTALKKREGRSKSFSATDDVSLSEMHLNPKEKRKAQHRKRSVDESDFEAMRKELADQRAAKARGNDPALNANTVPPKELEFLGYLVRRHVISEVDVQALLEVASDGNASQVSKMLGTLEEEILNDPSRDWPAIISDTMQAIGEGWQQPGEKGDDDDESILSNQRSKPYIADAIQRKKKAQNKQRGKTKPIRPGKNLARARTNVGRKLTNTKEVKNAPSTGDKSNTGIKPMKRAMSVSNVANSKTDLRAAIAEGANKALRRGSTGTVEAVDQKKQKEKRKKSVVFGAMPGDQNDESAEDDPEKEEKRRLRKHWTAEKTEEYAAWEQLGEKRQGPPGPPVDLRLMNKVSQGGTNTGRSDVSVSFDEPEWDGGDKVTEYVVCAEETGATSYDGSSYFVEYAKVEYGKVPTVTIRGLSNGKEYTIGVAAINAQGEGPVAEAGPWFTGAIEPSAPTKLSVVGTNLGVEVHFKPPKNTGRQKILRYHLVMRQQGEEDKGAAAFLSFLFVCLSLWYIRLTLALSLPLLTLQSCKHLRVLSRYRASREPSNTSLT